MKTVLESTKETLTHVKLPPHLHHQAADQCESREVDRQRNQVERLFPEFFTHHNTTRPAKSYTTGMPLNRKLEHRLNDPLIRSWLNMYGCNWCDNSVEYFIWQKHREVELDLMRKIIIINMKSFVTYLLF